MQQPTANVACVHCAVCVLLASPPPAVRIAYREGARVQLYRAARAYAIITTHRRTLPHPPSAHTSTNVTAPKAKSRIDLHSHTRLYAIKRRGATTKTASRIVCERVYSARSGRTLVIDI